MPDAKLGIPLMRGIDHGLAFLNGSGHWFLA
jgi:hypothetical protein